MPRTASEGRCARRKGQNLLKGLRGHQHPSSAEGYVWWTKSEVRLEEVLARGYLCTMGPKA